jgi:hypothetical protein
MRSVFIPPPRSSAELVGLEPDPPRRLSMPSSAAPTLAPPPAIAERHATASHPGVAHHNLHATRPGYSSAPLVSIRELRASPAWRRRRRATPASCPPRTASGGRPRPSRTAPASSSPGLACSVGRSSHVRACRNRGRREYWIFFRDLLLLSEQ